MRGRKQIRVPLCHMALVISGLRVEADTCSVSFYSVLHHSAGQTIKMAADNKPESTDTPKPDSGEKEESTPLPAPTPILTPEDGQLPLDM